ncbi:major histocompatibility complex class I-related gene protein-like isoform X1 [Thamnophis elegans]|uniref:major histocompatibility complex class I-related gene protein-like isoform X1 n=1 Tax=Thamnophis elegans TaxID=35005 RepID=UPI001377DEB4|nr:major histocompatibility complex class I-related gene protein-like isoform X1 [Thamnophis elegans]
MDRLDLFLRIPWNFAEGRIPRGSGERRVARLRRASDCRIFFLPALLLLLLRSGYSDGHTHSLLYLYTAVSESIGDLPQFTALGYGDGFLAGSYNSITERAMSRAPWMKKIEEEDPHFWNWMTKRASHSGQRFRKDLENILQQNNQSRELHVWQRLYGCELVEDGSERGYDLYAYDGKDFLSFNKATLNWTAANAEAEVTKKKWDADLDRGWRKKIYLEGECFAWLKKYLDYGTETRARKKPPVVTMSSRTEVDGMESLLCRAYGFYPKEIDAFWRRDGEVWLEDTLQGSVAPNSDGTYHYWLSIRIDPKERSHYRCHVEHDALQEPLDIPMEEAVLTGVYFRREGGMVIAVIPLVVFIGCIVYCVKKKAKDEEEESTTSDDDLEEVKDNR